MRVSLPIVVFVFAAACQPRAPTNAAAPAKKTATKAEAKSEAKSDGDDGDDTDAPKDRPKLTPLAPEAARTIKALEAENAALKRRIEEGKDSTFTNLINVHEHLYKLADLDRYLPAARAAGVVTTVVVSSPMFTLEGNGPKGEPGMSDNFENVVLEAGKKYPGEIVPFCTIDPHDGDKLERLKKHVAMGAKGLKIYTGHSNFYDDSGLNPPDMDPVFDYLEQTQLPINWHVNLGKFADEFAAVLKKHPKLNLMVPHYGVVFWRPRGPETEKLKTMLRTYPNLFIDTSLGTREILLDGMAVMDADRQVFVDLFKEFPDRIVWGTDSVITGNNEKTPAWYTKVIWATRDQLEKDIFTTDLSAAFSKYYKKGRDGAGRYQGLGVAPETMRKVYGANAKRWLKLP